MVPYQLSGLLITPWGTPLDACGCNILEVEICPQLLDTVMYVDVGLMQCNLL